MGTGSSVCSSDPDIPEYSPAYLGQIYAGPCIFFSSVQIKNSMKEIGKVKVLIWFERIYIFGINKFSSATHIVPL